jgi:DNA helicase TIP49 (TBP-interacting protein)
MSKDVYTVLTHTGMEISLCYAIQLITATSLNYREAKGHGGSDR